MNLLLVSLHVFDLDAAQMATRERNLVDTSGTIRSFLKPYVASIAGSVRNTAVHNASLRRPGLKLAGSLAVNGTDAAARTLTSHLLRIHAHCPSAFPTPIRYPKCTHRYTEKARYAFTGGTTTPTKGPTEVRFLSPQPTSP